MELGEYNLGGRLYSQQANEECKRIGFGICDVKPPPHTGKLFFTIQQKLTARANRNVAYGLPMLMGNPSVRRKKNIALFPAHRPGENFLRCHPAANKKIFFISLFNNEMS